MVYDRMFTFAPRRIGVTLCVGMFSLWSGATGGIAGADPPSPMFRSTGPAGSTAGFAPDDETARVYASDEVKTPHLSWARPWAKGPVRVLAISHKEHGRWPIELAQRFDFEVTTVYTHSSGDLGASGHGIQGRTNQRQDDVEARLLQEMTRSIDVVISNVPSAALGAKVNERLGQLIAGGVGYVGPTEGLELGERARDGAGEAAMVDSAVPVAALKTIHADFETKLTADMMIELWSGGDGGRVADVSGFVWAALPPDTDRLQYAWLVDMPWEAWCSLTGRAVLWAAGHVDAATIVDVNWPDEPLGSGALPWTFEKQIAKPGSSPYVRVWDADGQLQHRSVNPVLPRLGAGSYFVGFQVRSSEGIVDWAFRGLEIAGDQRIASIELDAIHKELNEKINAVIHVDGDLPADARLKLEVIDNFGRTISRRVVAAEPQVTFAADLAESLHLYNYVQATLIDGGGKALHVARDAFYIRQRALPHDDLTMLFWDPAGRYPSPRIAINRLVDIGMQVGLNGAQTAMFAANVRPVRWDYTLRVKADEEGNVSPDIASPGYINEISNRLRGMAEKNRPYSPLFYYVGDDVKYLEYSEDGGWNPLQRASLAKWADRRYGGLEQINSAWQTEYTAAADIEPVKLADALAAARDEAAPAYGPLCHWVDHQLHTDDMFINFYREIGKPINEVDPQTPSNAGTSVRGWPHPGCGVDFWKLAADQRLAIQYANPWVHDTFRSALAPGALHGIWYGGYAWYIFPPYYLDQDFLPWWGVFGGVNVHALFIASIGSANMENNALLASDYSAFPGIKKIVAHQAELKRGVAKLIFNAERVTDGVAVLYSPASLHASVVFDQGLPKLPEWKDQQTRGDGFIYMQCREGLAQMFSDLGLTYEVVATSQLESGEFGQRGFRVLVLPLNLRLSAGEAEAIRRFVDGGGVVVADVFAGLFDEHCRADHEGVLADVFGVTYAGRIPGPQVTMTTGSTTDGVELGRMVADGAVALTTAKAYGRTADDTPILTVNEYGRGRAIMLNVLARDYQIWRTAGTERPFRKVLGGLLAEAGVYPYPQVKCVVDWGEQKSHPIQVTQVHRYELGGGRYVGLLRHHKLRPDDSVHMADLRIKPVKIHFDQAAHVYDIRRGMYRGHTDELEDVIYPAQAELFALLPYEVRDVEVEAQWDDAAITVTAEVAADEPVTHVFRVELTGPGGRVRNELSQNIVAPQGRFQQRFFVGYNSQPKGWTVSVRDVASGLVRTVAPSF